MPKELVHHTPIETTSSVTMIRSQKEVDRTLDIEDYILRLVRYRWHLATFVVVTTTLVVMFFLTRTKLYQSTTTLQVDPNFTNMLRPAEAQTQTLVSTDALVATAQQLLQGPSVLNAVIDQLDLSAAPSIQHGLGTEAYLNTPAGRQKLLEKVEKMVSVSRPPGTLLLQLSVRTPDPALSAKMANSVAQSFLDQQYASHSQSISASSAYMASQLNDLRAAMEKSQSALVRYEITNDVLNPDDKTNIMQTRLTQINTDLSQTQSQRMALEAENQALERGDLASFAVTPDGQNLAPYITRLQRDKANLAKMSAIYGPKNVLYRQQQAVVSTDQTQLAEQFHLLQREVNAKYRTARRRESLIEAALQRQKNALDSFNLRAIRYTALKGEADSNAKLYYSLLQRIKEADVAANYKADEIRIVSPARPEYQPVYPKPILMGVLAMSLASLLGLGIIALAAIFDKTISNPEQAERWFSLPVLAVLPDTPTETSQSRLHLASNTLTPLPDNTSRASDQLQKANHNSFNEAIILLHNALLFAGAGEGRILAVSSAVPGEGKSTVITNLAIVRAELTRSRILIIDADMRKPTVHRRFGVTNRIGLSNLLNGTATPQAALIAHQRLSNMFILPAGPVVSNPSELLYTRFAEVIEDLKADFPFILIDSPPLLGFADASTVANVADDFLLIALAGQTERATIAAALRTLTSTRTTNRGIVLNRINVMIDAQYKYYYKAYGNYYNTPDTGADDEEA